MPKVKKEKEAAEATNDKPNKEKKGKGKGKPELPDNQVATLKALKSTGAKGAQKTRKELRENTGNHNLGLPKLTELDYVKEVVQEGKRARLFHITPKGKKLIGG